MLKTMAKLFKKNKSGFTLVELMAVVLIIGILVAIAIPLYQNSSKDAQAKACKSNIRLIYSAIEQYKSANSGTDPANLAALVGTDKYIKNTPVCPLGVAYNYANGALNESAHFATAFETAATHVVP